MEAVPARSPALVMATVFGGFVAGPLLGFGLSHGLAPGSELAAVASPLALVLTFAGGMLLWFGLGVVTVIGGGLLRMLRGRAPWKRAVRPDEEAVPSGHGAFLFLGVGLGLAAGVVVGSASPANASFAFVCIAHTAVGAAYGGALRELARRGYLPFPEPG
jgi:hypothetical protein